MFTPDDRSRLRASLLGRAARDPRIFGAAITGSAASDREDCWSDIDLAFSVGDAAELPAVLQSFTDRMYADHAAIHHVDVLAGPWIYRVFLLADTLQVDLAFVPASDFRAIAPTFRLISGDAGEPAYAPPPGPEYLAGMAWLYSLHARSAVARNHLWQALYMINGVRDHALMLACLRHGLPTTHARGIHELPAGVAAAFEPSIARDLTLTELRRAFRAVISALAGEIRLADAALAARLTPALNAMSEIPCES